MATSAKQIDADRRNARKSTGPRSPEGKAVSSRNANLIGSQSVPDESFRTSLMHHEMRLDRQHTRAYRLLHQLQHPNQSESPPHPATKNFFPENEPISTPPCAPRIGES